MFCQEVLVGRGAAIDPQKAVGTSGFVPDANGGRSVAKGASRSRATGWQIDEQVPLWQVWPAAQAVPACVPEQSPLAPQWVALVRGSTHEPPQAICPETGQAQAPPWQVSPAAQAVPACVPEQVPLAPQWVASVCGSTQALPQASRPAWQGRVQAPLVQTVPTPQMLPQEPQLRLSDPVCTQTPPQDTLLLEQVEATLQPDSAASARESSRKFVRSRTSSPIRRRSSRLGA